MIDFYEHSQKSIMGSLRSSYCFTAQCMALDAPDFDLVVDAVVVVGRPLPFVHLFCLLLVEESVRMKVWSRSLLPFCPNQGSWAFWKHPRRCGPTCFGLFWRGGSCSRSFGWDGRCSWSSWRDGGIRSRTRRSWCLQGLHPMHNRLVGCDGGTVSPSVGSAGFCAGASL